ncbi:hypothetical protein VTJ83DRAFT_4248 [Remersonia thermophila]|uniref:Uncharacterized protein n=1 Tax=Remersonia thermophila TaxID=72144 RepID=A0ABR4D9G0_9PEZI
MLVKSVAAFAALSLATGVAAEPLRPYKPSMLKMSTRSLFGVMRRDEVPGYQPATEVCGVGPTCAAACGAGYETCSSGDDEVHCFNPSAGEVCCPNRSGSSCDAGYYCAADNKGETWCCPDGQSLADCAASYPEVEGALVSQTPVPETATETSSSSSSSSTSATAATTKTSSSSSSAAKTTSSSSSSADEDEDDETSSASSFPATAVTTDRSAATGGASSEPTEAAETKDDENAAGRAIVAPVTAALAVVAAGFVALL